MDASPGQWRQMRTERKVITALFADIVGSTAIGEQLDPEDARQVIGGAVARLIPPVEEMGGVVKDLAGDGMLALFGAQQAHEDDPERAVRAALRIVDDLRGYAVEMASDWGLTNFGVRVGIETGLTVLGPVGAGARVEYGATGDAVNTAARLESHADPFTVVVGPTTHQLVESVFEWSQPRPLRLKGKADPVIAHQVMGLRTDPSRRPGVAGMTAALIGRDRELAIAKHAVRRLLAGVGGVMFVAGEPGVGKSRLLRELRAFLSAQGDGRWLEGRGVSYGQALPYWPFRDLLRTWAAASAATPLDVLQQLRKQLSGLLDSPDVHTHLAAMLGLPIGAEAERELSGLSPEARHFRSNQAMVTLVRALAAQGPVVVTIEDLHWADGETLQLLDRITELTTEVPVLVLLTQRPDPTSASWAWQNKVSRELPGRATVLTLKALVADAGASLFDAMVGRSVVPEPVRKRLLDSAEGNPLYLEELVRSLVDAGVLIRGEAGWRYEREVPLEIPPTVERLIISRIDRLSPEARSVLQTASVLGRQFDVALLRSLMTEGFSSEAITELLLFDLVHEERLEPAEYRFKHALIQEAAYNNMLRETRRELHARAAHAMESSPDGMKLDYGVLGRHHREAGNLAAALHSFELAAESASRVYAVDAALDNLTSAIDVARALNSDRLIQLSMVRGKVHIQSGSTGPAREDFETVLRDAAARGNIALEIEAMNEIGFLHAGAVNYQEALPMLEMTLATAKKIGLHKAEVIAGARLSLIYTNTLRLDDAEERSRLALRLARESGDEGAVGMALDAAQVVSVLLGDSAAVDAVSAELTQIHRRRGDLWYLQFALFQWAWVDMMAARWIPATRRFAEALAVNRSISDKTNHSVFLAAMSWAYRASGQYGQAIAVGREAFTLAVQAEHAEFLSWAAGILGWTFLEMYATGDAIECFERALEAAQRAGALIEMVRAACQLPLARHLYGDHEQAEQDALVARDLWRAVTAPLGRAYLQGADGPIALAEYYLRRGDPLQAKEVVQPILAAALTAKWHEVVTASALVVGACDARLGDYQGASHHLGVAVETAERFAISGLVWRAHAELARLLARPHPRRSRLHAQQCARRVNALSATIEDATMRQALLEGARSWLPTGEII